MFFWKVIVRIIEGRVSIVMAEQHSVAMAPSSEVKTCWVIVILHIIAIMTEKQKEALKVILELHKEGDISSEQVLTVVDAFIESTPKITYIPPAKTNEPHWISYTEDFSAGKTI